MTHISCMVQEETLTSNLRDSQPAVVYTAKELKALLSVNLFRIYRMAAEGKIPCIRAGKRFIFPKVAVDRWLAAAGNRTET